MIKNYFNIYIIKIFKSISCYLKIIYTIKNVFYIIIYRFIIINTWKRKHT